MGSQTFHFSEFVVSDVWIHEYCLSCKLCCPSQSQIPMFVLLSMSKFTTVSMFLTPLSFLVLMFNSRAFVRCSRGLLKQLCSRRRKRRRRAIFSERWKKQIKMINVTLTSCFLTSFITHSLPIIVWLNFNLYYITCISYPSIQ